MQQESAKAFVFGFGGDQDVYVFVCVLPENEEVLLGGAGPYDISFESISAGQAYVRKSANQRLRTTPRWSKTF